MANLSKSVRESLRHAEAVFTDKFDVDGCSNLAILRLRVLAMARAAYIFDLYKEHCARTPRWKKVSQEALAWRDEVGAGAEEIFKPISADFLFPFEAEFLNNPVGEGWTSVDSWFLEARWMLMACEAFYDQSGVQELAEGILSHAYTVCEMRPDVQKSLREEAQFQKGQAAHRGWVLEFLNLVDES